MKKTPWFSVRWEPPHREGWYEYRGTLLDAGLKLYWNGLHFGYFMGPGRKNWVHQAADRFDKWRGLAERPSYVPHP